MERGTGHNAMAEGGSCKLVAAGRGKGGLGYSEVGRRKGKGVGKIMWAVAPDPSPTFQLTRPPPSPWTNISYKTAIGLRRTIDHQGAYREVRKISSFYLFLAGFLIVSLLDALPAS